MTNHTGASLLKEFLLGKVDGGDKAEAFNKGVKGLSPVAV